MNTERNHGRIRLLHYKNYLKKKFVKSNRQDEKNPLTQQWKRSDAIPMTIVFVGWISKIMSRRVYKFTACFHTGLINAIICVKNEIGNARGVGNISPTMMSWNFNVSP